MEEELKRQQKEKRRLQLLERMREFYGKDTAWNPKDCKLHDECWCRNCETNKKCEA